VVDHREIAEAIRADGIHQGVRDWGIKEIKALARSEMHWAQGNLGPQDKPSYIVSSLDTRLQRA